MSDTDNMSDTDYKMFGLIRISRENAFRFLAFGLGFGVATLIHVTTTMRLMDTIVDKIDRQAMSPPSRAANLPSEKSMRDQIESEMKGAAYLEMKRHFEKLSPEKQKEIEEGLNDPTVRKMMDQMFEKSAEMFHQIEQIAETANE